MEFLIQTFGVLFCDSRSSSRLHSHSAASSGFSPWRSAGQLRVIADIPDPDLIRKILDHVNSRAPARLPPRRAESHQTPPDLFAER